MVMPKAKGSFSSFASSFSQCLSEVKISLSDGGRIDLKTLCEEGREAKREPDDRLDNQQWILSALLKRAHGFAHVEKELGTGEHECKPYTTHLVSTVFGMEIYEPGTICPADNRRPINDVTLCSWGIIASAFFKADYAALLGGQKKQKEKLDISRYTFAFRFFQVAIPTLSWLSEAMSVPMFLARRKESIRIFREVKRLLEGTVNGFSKPPNPTDVSRNVAQIEINYPVGVEVYRDENRIVFVVPDIPELFQQGAEICTRIVRCVSEISKGEIVPDPSILFHRESWFQWSIPPKGKWSKPIPKGVPPIGQILKSEIKRYVDVDMLRGQWQSDLRSICSACGLRPREVGKEICAICAERQQNRARDWWNNWKNKKHMEVQGTIWIDEVADKNGRVALIACKFE